MEILMYVLWFENKNVKTRYFIFEIFITKKKLVTGE